MTPETRLTSPRGRTAAAEKIEAQVDEHFQRIQDPRSNDRNDLRGGPQVYFSEPGHLSRRRAERSKQPSSAPGKEYVSRYRVRIFVESPAGRRTGSRRDRRFWPTKELSQRLVTTRIGQRPITTGASWPAGEPGTQGLGIPLEGSGRLLLSR